MERGVWTDERLDDLARTMDNGFARIDADLRDLRTDLGGRIDSLGERVGGRIDSLGERVGGRIDSLGERVDALQMTLLRVGGGVMIGLVGVIAAVLVRG